MFALAARLFVPLLLFAAFLVTAWALRDRAERRADRPQDPPAGDVSAPESEPPRKVPVAA